mgnify:FL=1
MNSKILNISKIFQLILKMRTEDNEYFQSEIYDEIIEKSKEFFDSKFIENFKNDKSYLNMIEAMLIQELESLAKLLNIVLF